MSEPRVILVTGAGGFIGGRMVEVLSTMGTDTVRAAVRRWSSGARIGRFPVEIVQCDVRNAEHVRDALRDVTHVVHCAVGDYATTVEGTRTLMAGALEAGVKRIVHLSTIDVYGAPKGEVDETCALTPMGRAYGDSKIEAERVCQQFAAKGLPVTILRPTLVHGPFSVSWTIGYAQRLQKRPWLIPASDAQGTCNLVYVDDLVGAVLCALEADTAPGEAFNVNGPERPTWDEYFRRLNDAMQLPPLRYASISGARVKAGVVQPFRQSAKLMLKHLQPQIMAAYQRFEVARTVMKHAESLIRTTPAPTEFAVYGVQASYSTEKAEQTLGYRPRFSLREALPLTAAWLRHNGFIESTAS